MRRLGSGIGIIFPGWSPDVAWRYLPMARMVRRVIGPQGTVLDVGAGGKGISVYLANRCVCTDREPPLVMNEPFVRSDATALPFADDSFDAVVQADVLEHLDPAIRAAAVEELFRVAKKIVVIGAPSGPKSVEHDRRLFGLAHRDSHLRIFLSEHFDCGLPSRDEIVRLVSGAGQKFFAQPELRMEKNANLRLRYLLMRGVVKVPDGEVRDRLLLRVPWSPLLARIRIGDCYRWIVACSDAGARSAPAGAD